MASSDSEEGARTVLVADASRVYREAVRSLLEAEAPGWELAGEAFDGDQAREAMRRIAPDVVLLDRALPDRGGLDLLEFLRAARPSTPVLMTGVDWDRPSVEAAFERGAAGVLTKHESAQQLIPALHRVVRGERVGMEGEDALPREGPPDRDADEG